MIRASIDWAYPALYAAMRLLEPERAHALAISALCSLGDVLHRPRSPARVDLAPAAGFDKEAQLPHTVLEALGFTRSTIGTITYEPWAGNPRPRIWRHGATIVNHLGLPGSGAEAIARRLERGYLPMTISVAPTPGTRDPCNDLLKTIQALRPYADRFELNLSCPNTDPVGLEVYHAARGACDNLYVKLSPDMGGDALEGLVDAIDPEGWVVSNTTRAHLWGRGGGSGACLYARARAMHCRLAQISSLPIVACGGIDSVARAQERVGIGDVQEVQLYTGLITRGPRLLSELRAYLACESPQEPYARAAAPGSSG